MIDIVGLVFGTLSLLVAIYATFKKDVTKRRNGRTLRHFYTKRFKVGKLLVTSVPNPWTGNRKL